MAFDQSIIAPLKLTEADLIKQLSKDILDIFSTMVGMVGISHTLDLIDPVHHFKNSVTAMVGMAGTYNSVVNMHTPQHLALAFASSMMGMELTEFDENVSDVSDAIGEITNMIAGSLKQQFSNGGLDIKLSTPSVVTGKEYCVMTGNKLDTITLQFSAKTDSFLVSVTLKKE